MQTYLNQSNINYIEQLFSQYQADPESVEPSWQSFFEGVRFGTDGHAGSSGTANLQFELNVLKMIRAYREMGYMIADVNPLDRSPRSHPLLELESFGLSDADLEKRSQVAKILGMPQTTIGETVAALRQAYCSPVAVEYSHIDDPVSRQWIQERVESGSLMQGLNTDWKKRSYLKLAQAEQFDMFLHKKFVGQKRFSAEGNDVIIPIIDYLVNLAGDHGTEEIIMGMAHRGRLNVLGFIFEKPLESLIAEFSGNIETGNLAGDGDVKYHIGYSNDIKTVSGKSVHLSLVSNPSHLEAVNSVVMGITRAKQNLKKDQAGKKTMALLMHGDSSFAGQGCIYETLNMSELEGYRIGGTVHIIINNQIGFTTMPRDARSTPQATDIAKMLEVPIFRVNADEPEIALRSIELALEYRNTFKRDVFIDLIGYRRFGHNESDEPAFTQPELYAAIKKHPRVREQYATRLINEGVLNASEVEAQNKDAMSLNEQAFENSNKEKTVRDKAFENEWKGFHSVNKSNKAIFKTINTTVKEKTLKQLGVDLLKMPSDFSAHPKIKRMHAERLEMIEGKRGIDWGCGESLAFASLLKDGFDIRLAGQDVTRGTFSHRHAGLRDIKTGDAYVPLNSLSEKNNFEVVNSLLSEFAALGFEFGQSFANPKKLTIWEAQFGDFVNGAQIIIDQFITSSASKWKRYSGLVMLLPHGYEGMGPEHSSAKLERFLQACAQDNIQVCNLSTPAQYFHVLRRQMLRDFRLPLIIMSPKSLLRHPLAASELKNFAKGEFAEILNDPNAKQLKNAERILLCSGKIYYELLQARTAKQKDAIPLLRLEQFYPFAKDKIAAALKAYPNAKELVWCQEEPKNMGAWHFVSLQLNELLSDTCKLRYVGRPAQASPSGGYAHIHEQEQQQIADEAFES